ncbi:MAG TPA: transglutaminase family protein [Burkholderiales bacterium]|nr:transglutaminase family protein [Burkholderiales bacterium]
MEKYLVSSEVIDWIHPAVTGKAGELADGCEDPVEIAKRSFEFVRDIIRHSGDFKLNPVTCKASDVLKQGTGYCYAKSHLLAALLRANGIPAGLCYQRLAIDDGRYCLHGLNAVFLPEYGWYRMDARGNKPGVHAEFCLPEERLAYPASGQGECTFADIFDLPLSSVVRVLEACTSYVMVNDNLPDIALP